MYKVAIDYDAKETITNHWYGTYDNVKLPKIPGSDKYFYNVISIGTSDLPVSYDFSVERIYCPHYFDSDFNIEDLFFQHKTDEVVLLGNWATNIAVYNDRADHKPRKISFVTLPDEINPASQNYDEDEIDFPHHQFWGIPFVLQEAEPLTCPICKKRMDFLIQFQRDFKLVTFGDCGVAYYWFCNSCAVVGCRVESL